MLKNELLRLLHVGFESNVFVAYKAEVDDANLNSLKNLSLTGTVIGGVMFLISNLPTSTLSSFIPGYAMLVLAMGLTYICTKTVLKRYLHATRYVWYALLILVFIASALIGTVFQPETNAVTMIVFIVALPLFFIDQLPVIYGLTGAMCIVFAGMSYLCKDPYLVRVDVINISIFYICSIVTYYQTVRAKMRDIVSRNQLCSQRDTDALTGLRNRRSFEMEINRCIAGGVNAALFLMFDIDNFKSINDCFGHDTGDRALMDVTAALHKHFRACDIIGRLGGDEFVMFLPSCSYTAGMQQKLSALIKDIGLITAGEDVKVHLGISAGVSRYPEDGATFQTLYKAADIALYKAKRNGKGRFAAYCEKADA